MDKLLFALALLVCAPAFAVSSSASMTSQGYTLTDLNPNDGIAPSISFGTTQTKFGSPNSSFSNGVGSVWGSSSIPSTPETAKNGPLYASLLDVATSYTLGANTAVTFSYLFHSVQSFASGRPAGTVLEPASFASLSTQSDVTSTGYVSQFSFDKVLTVGQSNATGSAFSSTVDYRLGTTDVSPVWARNHIEPPIVSPIPEPAEYALMLAGLFAVAFVAKRRGARRMQ